MLIIQIFLSLTCTIYHWYIYLGGLCNRMQCSKQCKVNPSNSLTWEDTAWWFSTKTLFKRQIFNKQKSHFQYQSHSMIPPWSKIADNLVRSKTSEHKKIVASADPIAVIHTANTDGHRHFWIKPPSSRFKRERSSFTAHICPHEWNPAHSVDLLANPWRMVL